MGEFNTIQTFCIWALPVIFAITLHEVAHGWAALQFGDRTAQMLGRLTINPIKHIDPIGTLLVPTVLFTLTGFLFGWAKPVPVTYQNLRNPKRDMAWVALAGPASNLVMACFWAMMIKVALLLSPSNSAIAAPLAYMGLAGVFINTLLMLLNLLPLPPLDGGRVLVSALPGPLAWKVSQIEPYGIFVLVGLLYIGVVGMILHPLMSMFNQFLAFVFSIPITAFLHF